MGETLSCAWRCRGGRNVTLETEATKKGNLSTFALWIYNEAATQTKQTLRQVTRNDLGSIITITVRLSRVSKVWAPKRIKILRGLRQSLIDPPTFFGLAAEKWAVDVNRAQYNPFILSPRLHQFSSLASFQDFAFPPPKYFLLLQKKGQYNSHTHTA